MPIFFNRNLDPFGQSTLWLSWSFTELDATPTLVSQQGTHTISDVTQSGGYDSVFEIGAEYDYNFFKPNNSDVYESDVIPYASYYNMTFFMRIDCTLTDDTVSPTISIIGSGNTSSLTVTISYIDANTTHILFEMYDQSSNAYTLSSDVSQGIHTIAMSYDDDNLYVTLFLDGINTFNSAVADYLWALDSPIHFENVGALGIGVSDIQFYDCVLDDNQIAEIHDNSFFKPAARTLDPFGDGSLVTAFRGVNNSQGDDQLKNFLSLV